MNPSKGRKVRGGTWEPTATPGEDLEHRCRVAYRLPALCVSLSRFSPGLVHVSVRLQDSRERPPLELQLLVQLLFCRLRCDHNMPGKKGG